MFEEQDIEWCFRHDVLIGFRLDNMDKGISIYTTENSELAYLGEGTTLHEAIADVREKHGDAWQ